VRITTISIFPDYFQPLSLSLVGKAIESGLVQWTNRDLRDFTHDVHRTVDDTPYGGGAGMVMRPEPWGEALDAVLADADPGTPPTLVVPSPSGVPFRQAIAEELASRQHLVFACGRYEGIDGRVAQWASAPDDRGVAPFDVRELSLGDYVLNGGEVAALAMIEAIVRLLPGVLGNPESLVEESYAEATDGLLEYPVYTKPASWRGLDVPEVLLSGHHGRVAHWRAERSRELTRQRRPDLLSNSG